MSDVVIKARHNGPYLVTGPISLTDADGTEYVLEGRDKIDGTHSVAGFQAAERAVRESEAE